MFAVGRRGYCTGMDEHRTPLQNDPDRADESLVADGHGEFVGARPGGAFDPRSYRNDDEELDDQGGDPAAGDEPQPTGASGGDGGGGAPRPGDGGARTSGPGEEIDKLR